MNDIKQALKTAIKTLKDELNRAEKALAALETEKPSKQVKPRAQTATTSQATGSTTTAAKALAETVTLDGILAQLKGAGAGVTVDAVASALKLPKGKANQAIKQLVSKGDIIVSGKQGRTKLYSLTPQE